VLADGYMVVHTLVPHFCDCSFSIVKILKIKQEMKSVICQCGSVQCNGRSHVL